ncbi:MAG: DUF4139 domain-containing protein [Myxococcota bacterium]
MSPRPADAIVRPAMELFAQSTIRRVVVHARGAFVTRSVEDLDAPADEVDVILRGITPHAQPGSVRASVSAPRSIVSVRAALETKTSEVQAGPTVQRVQALDAELNRLERERALLERRSRILAEATIDPGLAARAKQELVRERTQDALAAARVFDAMAERTDARMAEIEAKLRRLRLERQAAALEDAQTSSAARMGEEHPRRRIVTRLAGNGRVQGLEVTYAIAAARWWPLYTLRLAGERAASWWMEALIAQESGEDWSGVELALSTGDMIFDARLPELPSLRLGKSRPKIRASYRAPPTGLEAMFSGYDRVFAALSVSETVAFKAPEAPPPPPEPPSFQGMNRAEITEEMELPASPLMDMLSREQAEGAMPAMVMSAMPQSVERSRTAPPPLMSVRAGRPSPKGAPGGGGAFGGMAIPEPLPGPLEPGEAWLDFDRLRLGGLTEVRIRGRLYVETELSLRFVGEAAQRMDGMNPGLRVKDPKESRGNFDHRYLASGRAEIPSDGLPHRLRVGTAEAQPRFLLTTVPREAPDVHREAELANPFDAPLLEGPVDVYSDGSFLTTAWIDSTDRGGRFRVGMGVEERVRVTRNARFQEDTAGLLGGSTEVLHEVGIELTSGMTEAVTVEIRDRIPVTDDKSLEIKLLSESQKSGPLKQGDSEHPLRGGLRWSVRVEPRGQARVDYSYKMSFPSKNEIVGGNRREQ